MAGAVGNSRSALFVCSGMGAVYNDEGELSKGKKQRRPCAEEDSNRSLSESMDEFILLGSLHARLENTDCFASEEIRIASFFLKDKRRIGEQYDRLPFVGEEFCDALNVYRRCAGC